MHSVRIVWRLARVTLLSLLSAAPLRAQAAGDPPSGDTPLVPLATHWPMREGIAVMAPSRVNPITVEATSDGWVVVTPLQRWPEARDEPPTSHLYAVPADAERWTAAARRLLARLDDSSRAASSVTLPALGRGRIRFAPYIRNAREHGVLLQLVTCEGAYATVQVSASELDELTSALERATAAAQRYASRPTPPTLDRPYYATEVSCAARRQEDGVAPTFPASMPRASRRYTEIGVRLVVDTSGFVEPGSVALLPGAPPALGRVVRTLVARWRYQPAEWNGAPVRQIVTAVLAFDPDEEATRPDSARVAAARRERSLDPVARAFRPQPMTLVRQHGGWVHVRIGRWRADGFFEGYQEWFPPDSVDEWVARARELIAADSAAPRHPPPPRDAAPIAVGAGRVGNRLTVQYQTGWSSDTERLKLVTFMSGCGGSTVLPTEIDRTLLDRLHVAARSARLHRTLSPSEKRPYARGEVACPSFLPPTSAAREDLPGVWRYARAPYPSTLSTANVRAEVLSSFVVDTAGVASAATLEVAPGVDPRAVAALRQSIERVRFQPAARAGMRVPARVIKTWLFEPPASCADERDGIGCARLYSKEH